MVLGLSSSGRGTGVPDWVKNRGAGTGTAIAPAAAGLGARWWRRMEEREHDDEEPVEVLSVVLDVVVAVVPRRLRGRIMGAVGAG